MLKLGVQPNPGTCPVETGHPQKLLFAIKNEQRALIIPLFLQKRERFGKKQSRLDDYRSPE